MSIIAIVSIAVIPCILYLVVKTSSILLYNHRAHRFFKTKMAWLPVLPKPSLLPGNGLMLMTDKQHLKLTENHEKYGKMYGFYYGPYPVVMSTDLDLWRKILIEDGHKHINKIDTRFPMVEFQNSILQLEGEEWRKVRKIISPALTNSKIKSEEINSRIQLILQKLKTSFDKRRNADGSVEVNLEEVTKRYSLSVISLLTFRTIDIVDFEADKDSITESLDDMNRFSVSPIFVASLILPFLAPIARFHFYRSKAGKFFRIIRTRVEQVVEETLIARKSGKQVPVDEPSRYLIDMLVDAYVDGKINYEQLIGNATLIIPSGTDSTSGALNNLIWNLVQNEEIQDKLRREITEKGTESQYLSWCVLEAIRWCPPVPSGVGRILSSDLTHEGKLYPKGVAIMACEWSKHRNPEIWPEPDKFMPERFGDLSKLHPYAFSAFSMGPRSCVGERLALHEMKTMTEFLLTNYKLEKCSRTPDTYSVSVNSFFWFNLDREIYIKLTPLARSSSGNSEIAQ